MTATPIHKGFEYEVKLAVSIPAAWAELLKKVAVKHYDWRCKTEGAQMANGLLNTAVDSEYPSTFRVSWRDLDLLTKVAEQMQYHTDDFTLITTIRGWLRESKDLISAQERLCAALPGSAA